MIRVLPLANFLPRVDSADTVSARFANGKLMSITIKNKVQTEVCELYNTEPHTMIDALWIAIQKRYV